MVSSSAEEKARLKSPYVKEQINGLDEEGKKQYQKYLKFMRADVSSRKKSVAITHRQLSELLDEYRIQCLHLVAFQCLHGR
jgi:hypothetical protein